jgi:hypothetical protein
MMTTTTMTLDPETKAKHERDTHYGDPDAHELDEEQKEILREQSAPLQEVYPEDFQRYLDLFFKFFPKTPVHARYAYGQGFICQKGKRIDRTKYDRGCYPDMIARMLDLERWQHNHPNVKCPEYYWVAMREPKASSLKAIDLDNKNNVLGHYNTREMGRSVSRPLPILTVEHMQKIKRVYDAFSGHIWCVSSATLGLHIWEKLPGPQPLNLIEAQNRRILKTIGLGKTEIHPMQGRALRRPFGHDYFTITENGLLDDWRDQLEYFKNIAATPSFEAIFKAMRQLVDVEWTRFLYDREPGKVRISSSNPELAILIKRGSYSSVRDRVLHELDQWAAGDFQLTTMGLIDVPTEESPAPAKKATTTKSENISVSFNGKWVQLCRSWCLNGLPEDDSLFVVISNLAIWFYFVEFHEAQEPDRRDKIVKLLIHFCQTKHNGFITRMNLGQKQEVVEHIERIVHSAIEHIDSKGKELFARIRAKRESGGYSTVYFLEPLIHQSGECFSSSVVLTQCCSVLSSPSAVVSPENWVFAPDNTPLPDELDQAIQKFYQRNKLKMNKPTEAKIVRFINFIRAKVGGARIGVKSLKKMGFSNHAARQHIKNLEKMRIIATEGYCPAAHISKLYRFTERTKEMFSQNGD